MKFARYIACFLLLPVFLATEGAFRGPDFNFMHLSTENGLPSNRVRDIVQDSDGFMWFATDGGLVRYDGVKTKVFEPSDPQRLEDNVFVMTLAPYRDGLLVGTDKGLYGYDSRYEKLAMLPLSRKGSSGKEFIRGNVVSMAVNSDETVWVAVSNRGVYKISPKGEVEDLYEFPEADNLIAKVYSDDNDALWVLVNAGGGYLYKYDPRDPGFRKVTLTVDGEKINPGGAALLKDEAGDFWLGTWDEGLIRFNERTGEGKRYCNNDKFPVRHIHTIAQYSPRLLFVGSDSGLMLLDVESGECCLYLDDELKPESMRGQFVYPITKDSAGGFWIGTFYKGINYLGKGNGRFQNWHHSLYANSVGGNVIARLCEDNSGNIWVGSADGGLCRYNPETREFKHFSLSGERNDDNVNALCPDGEKLWVGMYAAGAGYLIPETGRWYQIPVENEQLTSCYAICRDHDGNIWMAATQTLAKYNPEKRIFEKVKEVGAWINDIDEDEDGYLWIATQGDGLYRYSPGKNEWRNYQNTGQEGDLPHNHINNVKVADNIIYVSTPKGVSLYNRDHDNFYSLQGFPDGVPANSLEKSGEDIWVSSNIGLLLLKHDGQFRQYTASDGLGENQFLPSSSLRSSNGMLYFGNVNGFTGIDPLAVRTKGDAPKMMFTSLNIINDPVEVGDKYLPSSLNTLKKLELDNSANTFTIFFSALNYDNPRGNRYAYRLEGFDKTWHEPENDNSATYSNLPPGTYTLRVKGANSDGVWNDEGISLKIVVKPVWYMTTLMKLLYLVIAIGLLLLGLKYVLWRIERNHARELERISDNKEKEMFRSKLSFFTVVAHEIRTPVSLIIGPLEKVMNSGEKFSAAVKSDLQVIDRNARRLLSLVNQLLDYKKVEDNSLPIGFRHEKIIPLIESIVSRFRPTLEQKGISLTENFPDPEMEVDIDPEAITKLVSNLMNNAMKFTKNSISVKCGPAENQGMFEIEVKDNGIGIGKENHDKIFHPFYQVLDNINEARGGTGLGLSIVKSVVDAHGGEIRVDSDPGHGAAFRVILPRKQKDVIPAPPKDDIIAEDVEEMSPSDEPMTQQDPVLLVVDDNEEMVKFISSHFEKNYEVVTASNGQEALERMKEKRVAMIICDWMMPVMDGEEFLRKIRHDENYSHIPFVMLTAKTDNASKITTMKSGADAYVEKPFSISYLQARIENLLEMRALLRKKYSKMPLEPLSTVAQTEIDSEFLKKLQGLIEENFSNPNLNVDYLAEHLGISRSGLYAKIRSLADVTPNELIQITRLKKAAELLTENKYRINEICYMVGFNSSSYFSRCFQKQFGMKPGEFTSRR